MVHPAGLPCAGIPIPPSAALLSAAYAFIITLIWVLQWINRYLAFGPPRSFDWTEEVVLITGAQVEAAKRHVEEELGTVTVLINNAAVVHGKPLLQLSFNDVENMVGDS
ncbi:hypothetical protein FN846DRAFT_911708 [Sphaerosporella brunnea]|uniref:Uncharacterized protein n=1 Tax=Sphaerosporella brunnea TaxID=1250544 RepID=A0A5J5EII9_9PEZI|nr:hypothetical protein FN846DRAFT_911708 [Sphaerosporella brunnea]